MYLSIKIIIKLKIDFNIKSLYLFLLLNKRFNEIE